MAFVNKRSDCRVFYVIHKDGRGKRVRKNTGLLISDPGSRGKAEKLAAQLTVAEQKAAGKNPTPRWSDWVEKYINQRYQGVAKELTRQRYAGSWKHLYAFFTLKGIKTPSQLNRQDCYDYRDWRMTKSKSNPRPAHQNTVHSELRLLGLILDEAQVRHYAAENVARRLHLESVDANEKPEISLEEERRIRSALRNKSEDMQVQFTIAINHGCRLRETRIDLNKQIDWQRGMITFRQKGGKKLSVPMAPEVRSLLLRRKAAGHDRSCEMGRNASKQWCQFFDQIGLPDVVFHCCRVTVISRLARHGEPESKAMKFVGHRSREVHRIYQRLRPDDFSSCFDAIRGDRAGPNSQGVQEDVETPGTAAASLTGWATNLGSNEETEARYSPMTATHGSKSDTVSLV